MRMIRAVLFDMDGTIIDSENIHTRALQEATKETIGIDITKQEIREYIGLDYHLKLDKILNKRGIKADTIKISEIARKKSIELSHLVKKMEYIDKVIKDIKKNFKVALVSGSTRDQVENLLNVSDLKKYFDIIVSSSDVKRNKPYPDSYLLAVKKLNVKPNECVVIEDSITGVEAAKNAGMICIAVLNEYIRNQDLSKADLIIELIKDISSETILSFNK